MIATRIPGAYPVAQAAAARVHPHFVHHAASSRPDAGRAGIPDIETIETIIDVAFWASLRREEGFAPRISLAFVSPDQVDHPLTLERPLPLASPPLTRLAPAVEGPGIHLGISKQGGVLQIWGATRRLPPYAFVLEVLAPGVLVVKHSRGEDSGKFINVAVIEGDRIKVIDQGAATMPDCPSLLTSLLGFDSQFGAPDSVSVLIQLAVSMRNHGRGGSLLVVPPGSDEWSESILQPITYSVKPVFSVLADLMQEEETERARRRWRDALRRAVDAIGGLTAVDGATILTTDYGLLAFGAKIIRRPKHPQVEQIILTQPIEGSEAVIAEPGRIGGTRHLSAAQFTHDQRNAIALVASQDGRFTVFGWSATEEMVHAHRIESLLL